MNKTVCSAILMAALTSGAAAAEEKVVDFYFLDPTSVNLKPTPLLQLWQTGKVTQDGEKNNYICKSKVLTMESGGVVIEAGMGENTKNQPRLFWQGGTTVDTDDLYLTDFRIYKSNTVSVTAPEGSKITQIVMYPKSTTKNKANCCDKVKIEEACGGTQTITGGKNLWTAPEGGVDKATYTVDTGANTQAIYRMYVTLNSTSAITDVTADEAEGPVEYFDLRGVRCNADNLLPGIYIRRQGSKSEKIIVKTAQ